jgi:hypothetical protein
MDDSRIIMEFVGGSEDGSRYDNTLQARVYYWSAEHGRVGARFHVIPEARFTHELANGESASEINPEHIEVYEIAERRDEWDHIFVRAQYLGRDNVVPTISPRDRGKN